MAIEAEGYTISAACDGPRHLSRHLNLHGEFYGQTRQECYREFRGAWIVKRSGKTYCSKACESDDKK